MKKQIMNFVKITFCIIAANVLSSCLLMTKTGTVVIQQRPYELSITETKHLNTGYLIKINGEEVGIIEAKSRSASEVILNPIETKYGTLTAEWKTDYHVIDSDINFRFYLDGTYIGTVNYW